MTVWYLDSSAIVKFAVREPETAALVAWRAAHEDDVFLTVELAITEVLRAVDRVHGEPQVALAHLDSLEHLAVDRDLLLDAARLGPPVLRSLDAIHLAAATAAGDDLGGVVTFDDRQAAAARALGMPVVQPGR